MSSVKIRSLKIHANNCATVEGTIPQSAGSRFGGTNRPCQWSKGKRAAPSSTFLVII
jgi:hypothetical protein